MFQAAHLNTKTISVPARAAVLPRRVNLSLTNQMKLPHNTAPSQRRQVLLWSPKHSHYHKDEKCTLGLTYRIDISYSKSIQLSLHGATKKTFKLLHHRINNYRCFQLLVLTVSKSKQLLEKPPWVQSFLYIKAKVLERWKNNVLLCYIHKSLIIALKYILNLLATFLSVQFSCIKYIHSAKPSSPSVSITLFFLQKWNSIPIK